VSLIDDAIARYHELLFDRHLDAMRAHLARTVAAAPGADECRVLRPSFIGAGRHARALEAAALVNEAFLAAGRRLHEDAALRRSLGIPRYLDEMLTLDHARGEPSVMVRIDGLLPAGGDLQVIEYNAQPEFDPASVIDDMFATAPIVPDFTRRYPVRTQRLNDFARAGLRAAAGGATTTIAVPEGNTRAREWLREVPAGGDRVTFAPYAHHRLDGGRLVVDDEGTHPVDVVALPWTDLAAPTTAMQPVLDALRSGAVRALDGLALGLLCSYKHTLELLSDPVHAAMFRPAVALALARHVPWTRIVRERRTSYGDRTIDLVPFIAAHREHLVLKPSGGARGEGVVIGRLCDDATWTRTLERARKQPYVAQAWIAGEIAPYPPSTGAGLVDATSDFNPFVWNGDPVRGSQVRLSTTGKHSPDQAWVTGVWVLEDA
jgi:hypothetical protein